jgi:hypothetical protein
MLVFFQNTVGKKKGAYLSSFSILKLILIKEK